MLVKHSPSLWPADNPLAKASHIAKLKAKRQQNKFHLFNGTNCKISWQRMWIWEEGRIGPINAVYNSSYHISGTVPGTEETVLTMTEVGLLEFTVKKRRLKIHSQP